MLTMENLCSQEEFQNLLETKDLIEFQKKIENFFSEMVAKNVNSVNSLITKANIEKRRTAEKLKAYFSGWRKLGKQITFTYGKDNIELIFHANDANGYTNVTAEVNLSDSRSQMLFINLVDDEAFCVSGVRYDTLFEFPEIMKFICDNFEEIDKGLKKAYVETLYVSSINSTEALVNKLTDIISSYERFCSVDLNESDIFKL